MVVRPQCGQSRNFWRSWTPVEDRNAARAAHPGVPRVLCTTAHAQAAQSVPGLGLCCTGPLGRLLWLTEVSVKALWWCTSPHRDLAGLLLGRIAGQDTQTLSGSGHRHAGGTQALGCCTAAHWDLEGLLEGLVQAAALDRSTGHDTLAAQASGQARTGTSEACFRTSYRLPRWQYSMMMSGGSVHTPAQPPRASAAHSCALHASSNAFQPGEQLAKLAQGMKHMARRPASGA